MSNRLLVTSLPLCALAVCLCVWMSGCDQGIGGGAYSDVSVKVRSATLETTADDGAGTSTTTTDQTATGSGPGTFSGRVVFDTGAISFPPLIAQGQDVKDKQVCSAEAVPNEKLVVDSSGGIANVFIFLDAAPKGYKPEKEELEPILFDQKNCYFRPHALVLRAGQPIRIINSDPVAHNANIQVKRSQGFSQTVNSSDTTGVVTSFAKSEKLPARVTCEFHNWMEAHILVADHPFAVVTAADGSFEIPNLPSGTHTFRVWHEAASDPLERGLKVTVKPGESTTMELKYGRAKFSKL